MGTKKKKKRKLSEVGVKVVGYELQFLVGWETGKGFLTNYRAK